MLTWEEIESRAIAFKNRWKDEMGNEKQQAQTFEKDFMNIFGIDFRDGNHEYEVYKKNGEKGFIDYFIPGKILIEMKSKGESLLNAYNQAMDYYMSLKNEELPELIMCCDFDKIQVYNTKKNIKYKIFRLKDLKKHIRIFSILRSDNADIVEEAQIELNIKATEKMAILHDKLEENGYTGHELEIFLTRILFCFFAEDSGIFEYRQFHKYILNSSEDGKDLSYRISELFNVLNTSNDKRMKTISEELKAFRYINGSIFEEKISTVHFDKEMRKILIECSDFNWSSISPTIFGSMFQGVMAEEKRRNYGAHYTSEENILKVLKPLFLDELYKDFEKAKISIKDLEKFHEKLSTLKFLDPACGSGNFLILAYQKIRELEFEILKLLYQKRQHSLFDVNSKVSIKQFYGIEIDDFSSEIAKISLIIMKHIMDQKIGEYFGKNIIDFPIKENANIKRTNSLYEDWETVDYIMGNPPFVGKRFRTVEQTKDIEEIASDIKKAKNLDYVTMWFIKAAKCIGKKTRCAFVSTNSIVQGEQVEILWSYLLKKGINIDFAYRSFKWSNEAKGKAQVHCVIIGFSRENVKEKYLFYEDGTMEEVKNINPYLQNGRDLIIKSETKHIQKNILQMNNGNIAIDNNYLKLSQVEYNELSLEYGGGF